MTSPLHIRNMTRTEVDDLVAWADSEGWNPGLHDAGLFWATDPDAFIAADLDGELIGGGAVTSYQGEFGFMGFFIVRPEFRGRGLGNELWHARKERMRSRLRPGASVGLDGVFEMQDYYAKGGFVFSHRNVRFQADIPARAELSPIGNEQVVDLDTVSFAQVRAYDRACFPADREAFLRGWISQPEGKALGCLRGDTLSGFGVARRCGRGYKIGPLFADDGAAAEAILSGLSRIASGGPLFLDAPENNQAAMDLVRRLGMVEVFGCARMYLGHFPDIEQRKVFGVTTFELG